MAELQITCDVGGTVVKLDGAEGATLAAGDVLLTVESMKMEIPVEAPQAGSLLRLLVAVGDVVEEGQAVAVLRTA